MFFPFTNYANKKNPFRVEEGITINVCFES